MVNLCQISRVFDPVEKTNSLILNQILFARALAMNQKKTVDDLHISWAGFDR